MKKILLFASLLFVTNATFAYTMYYPPAYYNPYYNPYVATPYSNVNVYNPWYQKPTVVIQHPTNINNCPLQPSYYDANGNWVAAKRVC